ncbi:hypothetical protein J0910_30490 [Nocardiopsis sp. CNT-189]|uniref:NucA/NucB deoxyribonuclease domain-containing protein n=1 Tax=Nocardiopsis oceanisediminis TaxID=2816862 RepID=UPI003B35E4AE
MPSLLPRPLALRVLMVFAGLCLLLTPAPAAADDAAALAGGPSQSEFEELLLACENRKEAGTEEGWLRDRFSTCKSTIIEADIYEIGSAGTKVIGKLNYSFYVLAFASPDERRLDIFTSVFGINALFNDPLAYDKERLRITQTFTASTSGSTPVVQPTRTSRDDLIGEWKNSGRWQLTYTSPHNGSSGTGNRQLADLELSMDIGASHPQTNSYSEPGLFRTRARFDSAAPSGQPKHGTVLADTPGLYTLSLDDPAVEQTALHIYDAQNRPERTFPSHLGKTVPGKKPQGQEEGRPLHRMENKKKKDKNRRAAGRVCTDVWGDKGDGDLVNCDEYPFASTYEGASTGDRRSFSARLIGGDDNKEAGHILLLTYQEQRILDGDPFYVQITGTP